MANQSLKKLNGDLARSQEYKQQKDQAMSLVRDYFISLKGPGPSAEAINEHFLQKNYSKAAIDISETQTAQFYEHELYTAFDELTSLGLFSRSKKELDESNAYFSKAKSIADGLQNAFLMEQYNFNSVLDGEALQKKLQIEHCIETANSCLENDNQEGFVLLGTGLAISIDITDRRRELDFYLKCQYALYELENYPHVALSLGEYIKAECGPYEAARAWAHFLNGNIWLDLQNPQKAKEAFEDALEWAVQTGHAYAMMTFYERLGIAYKNLDKLNLAQQSFEDSLAIAEAEEVPALYLAQNQVRCLIGLGLVHYEIARKVPQPRQAKATFHHAFEQAQGYLKQAVSIAEQVKYYANKAEALSSLGDLYRLRHGDSHADARCYHKLAYQIKTDTLGLDPQLFRVKHDAQYR